MEIYLWYWIFSLPWLQERSKELQLREELEMAIHEKDSQLNELIATHGEVRKLKYLIYKYIFIQSHNQISPDCCFELLYSLINQIQNLEDLHGS